ncbi:MAG: hypothetical protein ACXADA_24630 [Candidatus Hodarchaeales archaeon]|jgi:hypothetical protein
MSRAQWCVHDYKIAKKTPEKYMTLELPQYSAQYSTHKQEIDSDKLKEVIEEIIHRNIARHCTFQQISSQYLPLDCEPRFEKLVGNLWHHYDVITSNDIKSINRWECDNIRYPMIKWIEYPINRNIFH